MLLMILLCVNRKIKQAFAMQDYDNDDDDDPIDSDNQEGIVVAGREFTLATFGLGFQIFAFLGYIGSAISTFISALPFLFFVALITIAMVPWINYNDVIVEEVEFALRCQIEPVWANVVKPFFDILQIVYESLICWWNSLWGYFFLIYREVIYPLAQDCGIFDVLRNLLDFFTALLFGVASFLASWLTASGTTNSVRLDFTLITSTFQAFWGAWQNTVCCACGTLCKILRTLPIFPTILIILAPVPNVIPFLPFIAGDQLADNQTWCAIDNAVNAVFEVVRIVLNLVFDLIQLPVTGIVRRPDFRPLANLLCDTLCKTDRSSPSSSSSFFCF